MPTMKATLLEARTALMRPKNMAIAAGIIAVSGLIIYAFGYVQWRRFVMPVEICATGWIGLRIAARIKQAAFSQLINTASKGILVCSGVLFICAWIDNLLFGDIGNALFVANVLMWMWIAFQLHRLDNRLSVMTPDEQRIITESTDVTIATLSHRFERIGEELDKYNAVRDRLGLEPSPYVN